MDEPGQQAVVVGVAGGSGSGKTTVAEKILEAIGPDRLAFLSQDSYYRDVEWKGHEEQARYNFDHPHAIDTDLLVEHVAALKRGQPVEVPVYDFVIHRRRAETIGTEPRRVVLVEGILLFVEPALRDLLDFKIFVDTDSDVRLARRLERDIAERGRTMESVLHQYMTTVRPMHLEFVEPSKRWADIIVPEGGENRVALGMVTARLEQLLGGALPDLGSSP